MNGDECAGLYTERTELIRKRNEVIKTKCEQRQQCLDLDRENCEIVKKELILKQAKLDFKIHNSYDGCAIFILFVLIIAGVILMLVFQNNNTMLIVIGIILVILVFIGLYYISRSLFYGVQF